METVEETQQENAETNEEELSDQETRVNISLFTDPNVGPIGVRLVVSQGDKVIPILVDANNSFLLAARLQAAAAVIEQNQMMQAAMEEEAIRSKIAVPGQGGGPIWKPGE